MNSLELPAAGTFLSLSPPLRGPGTRKKPGPDRVEEPRIHKKETLKGGVAVSTVKIVWMKTFYLIV